MGILRYLILAMVVLLSIACGGGSVVFPSSFFSDEPLVHEVNLESSGNNTEFSGNVLASTNIRQSGNSINIEDSLVISDGGELFIESETFSVNGLLEVDGVLVVE